MNRRAALVCGAPGCPEPATRRGRCARHQRAVGRPWRRLRARVLDRARGRCEACGHPCDTLAVHHVIPVVGGGAELPPVDDLLAVCPDCHRRLGWG